MSVVELKRGVFICLLMSLVAGGDMQAQDTDLVAHWSFDHIQNNKTPDSVSGIQDTISGNHRLACGFMMRRNNLPFVPVPYAIQIRT
ncbi:MAG TPA: hypothetical protein HPP87_13075 [Planctomycetes bacterium]|nr:hypothetical protein [Planctomycetota bacterium]